MTELIEAQIDEDAAASIEEDVVDDDGLIMHMHVAHEDVSAGSQKGIDVCEVELVAVGVFNAPESTLIRAAAAEEDAAASIDEVDDWLKLVLEGRLLVLAGEAEVADREVVDREVANREVADRDEAVVVVDVAVEFVDGGIPFAPWSSL
ncbi:hypothetical protein LTR56_021659 [Elasticomyces elasticus]|nr:hypothetical protein LTR56_021659 [Elasticomyces elasticus]KAK3640851.1 hypothetical protein LTR22_016773 [Elasticomyces elasticus]KAK4920348.1 hypothetical protein LTR49_012130 [Elasticomyces elasticus]